MTTPSSGGVLAALAKTSPKEYGGPVTSNRITYQHSWILCLILELHKSDSDYAILVDYHDDVVVFDRSHATNKADFYQIKTTRGDSWTLARLLKAPTGDKSFIAKLYDHTIRFPGLVGNLFFESNRGYKVKQAKSKSLSVVDKLTHTDLAPEDFQKLNKAIGSQLGLASDPSWDAVLHLTSSDLSLAGHEEHSRGIFQNFLEDLEFETNAKSTVGFKSLLAEIRKRNNCEGKELTEQELLDQKAITRPLFENIIQQILRPQTTIEWSMVSTKLEKEEVPLEKLLPYGKSWQNYEIARLDSGNAPLQRIRETVCEILNLESETEKLKSLIESVREELYRRKTPLEPFSRTYVETVILFEHCEKLTLTDPQPQN